MCACVLLHGRAACVCIRIALQLKLGAPAENCGRRPGQEPGRRARATDVDTWSHAIVYAITDSLNDKYIYLLNLLHFYVVNPNHPVILLLLDYVTVNLTKIYTDLKHTKKILRQS